MSTFPNINRILLVTLLLVVTLFLVNCPETSNFHPFIEVRGLVTDSITTAPLELATVYFFPNEVTYTDSVGNYTLFNEGPLPIHVNCSISGYITKTLELDLLPSRVLYDSIDFELAPIVTE